MKEKFVIEIGHRFIILSQLGRGAFGKVYECINVHTHKTVALKVMRKYKLTTKQLSFAEQECKILQKLNHPNIVKLFALYHTESFLLIEMEYLKEHTLAEYLSNHRLTEDQSSTIMQTIFMAVSYMHKLKIVHRDLKPENIIFATKDLKSLKIADFGLSTEIELGEKLDSQAGTCIYMAPEQLYNRKYCETADIWSCGIILYKLLTGQHPLYTQGDSFEIFRAKLNNIHWKFPKSITDLGKDLFLRCVKINPIERYSASLALNHPWITHSNNRIPITHLEEIREHQDKLKAKVFCLTALLLSAFSIGSLRQPKPKTCSNASLVKKEGFRTRLVLKTVAATPKLTSRNNSALKIETNLNSIIFRELPKVGTIVKSSGCLKKLKRKTGVIKIPISPVSVKWTPKSADR